jgi:hypothetical protein
MLQETIHLSGDVKITLLKDDGSVEVREAKNLIVSGGKVLLARLLGGDASYKNLEHVTKIAFGTGSTPAAASQTALVAQALSKTAVVSYPAFNQVKFTVTMEANEGGTNTYQEIGLLSAGTNILFSRIVISPITKSTAYKIQVEWTISFQ